MSAQLLGPVAALGWIWLVTSMLGQDAFGLLVLAMSLIGVTTFFASAVVERPAFLQLSRLPETGAEPRVARIAGAAFAGSVAIGAAVGAGFWALAPTLAWLFGLPGLAGWLELLVLMPPMSAGWMTLASCLQARRRAELAALGGPALHAWLQLGLTAVAALVWPSPVGVAAALSVAAAVVCLFLARSQELRPCWPGRAFDSGDFAYGRRLALTRTVTHVELSLDLWLVGLLSTGQEIALYALAKRLAMLLKLGKDAMDALLLPRSGRALVAGAETRPGMLRELRLARAVGFAFASSGLLAIAAVGPTLLDWLGGYGDALALVFVLGGAQLVLAGAGSVGEVVAVAGHASPLLRVAAISSTLFLALGAALGSVLGPAGVALAAVVSAALRRTLETRIARRLLGLVLLGWATGASVVLMALGAVWIGLAGGEASLPILAVLTGASLLVTAVATWSRDVRPRADESDLGSAAGHG